MSEQLEKALANFDWNTGGKEAVWRIHYNPSLNGFITEIVQENFSESKHPYIEVTEAQATEFIKSQKYQREYHVVNGKLEFKVNEHNIHKASDARIGLLTIDDVIDPGVYFVTVQGEPDLVIDTIEVNSDNLDAESKRIKEYLKNNDVYKDSE